MKIRKCLMAAAAFVWFVVLVRPLAAQPFVSGDGPALCAMPEEADSALESKSCEGGAFRIRVSNNDDFDPAVAYGDGDFLVVNTAEASPTNHNIRARFVNPDGTVGVGWTIDVSSVNSVCPDVAYSRIARRYLVVWAHRADGAQYDIYGKILRDDGLTAVSTFIIACEPTVNEFHPCVMCTGDGHFLVLWDTTGAGDYINSEIYARRVGSDGALGAASYKVSPTTYRGSAHPKAAGGLPLAVWQHAAGAVPGPVDTWDWDVVARIVYLSGEPVGDLVTVSDAVVDAETHVGVAWSEITGDYLVVWQRRDTSSDYDIMGSMLRATYDGDAWAISTGEPFGIYGTSWSSIETDPAVSWSARTNRFLVVWTHPFAGDLDDLDIMIREVEAGGELHFASNVSSYGDNNEQCAAVACASPVSLVVWEDERTDIHTDTDLYGRRYVDDIPFRVRVSGIEWSNNCRTATVSYLANKTAERYYYRLYQTQPTYTGTSGTSATFTGLGTGYYLVVITARDSSSEFAPEPCRVWFFNRPVGSAFQVYIVSYVVGRGSLFVTLGANADVSRYYARLSPGDTSYHPCGDAFGYIGVFDGLHYLVATGRNAATGDFPPVPPGPARQFIYVDTAGFYGASREACSELGVT